MKPITLFASIAGLMTGTSGPLFAQVTAPAASDPKQETIQMDAFTVAGETASGYGATMSNSATRMNTALMGVPQTINVITDKFLADTFAMDSQDAVRYIPNVARRTANHQPGQYIMRGFVTGAVFFDGFRVTESNRDMANISRVEVIKGPASASVGRGEVGGVISFITKHPLSTPQAEVDLTVGSENLIRAVGDVTGPLDAGKKVNYRLIGVYHDADDIKPFAHTHKRALFPSVEWKISDRTVLNVSWESLHISAPMNSGRSYITSKLPGNSPGLPDMATRRDFQKAEPWDKRNDDVNSGIASLVHAFNGVFSTHQSIQLQNTRVNYNWALGGVRDTIDPVTKDILIARTARQRSEENQSFRHQGDFLAQYDALGGKHQTLLGTELEYLKIDGFQQEGALAPINYTHPVYGAQPTNLATTANGTTMVTNRSLGLIGQQQSGFLGNKLNFIAGMRVDYRKSLTDYLADARPNLEIPVGKPTISPRYGVTVMPVRGLSIYAVKSNDDQPETISPRYNLLPAGDPRLLETLKGARTGELQEAGIKAEVLKGQLSMTFSTYKMTRKNAVLSIVKTLPNGSAYNEFFLSEGERVEGLEAQVFGQLGTRLDLMASYASVTRATSVLATGITNIPAIPTYQFNVFASYSFHDKGKDGFSVRAGYVEIGKMWGHINNYWRFGSQHRADAGVSYARGRYRFDLQLNNVFDDDFIPSTVASDNLAETPPRQIFFSVTRRFY